MSRIEELKNEIKELEEKIKALQEELIETQKTDISYPFNYTDKCYLLETNGFITEDWWSHSGNDQKCYRQGNFFETKKEALREHYRRELLTRFRQFRDKCNGDWIPESEKAKYYIFLQYANLRLCVSSSMFFDAFNMFGYFKSPDDCKRAIELFGDEIKRLYVEE